MTDVVLDSSAFLALINGEPGSATVAALLDDAVISSVNYAEVVTKIVDRGASMEDTRRELAVIDIPVIDFDTPLAERAGGLRTDTRRHGLSLGDRACLALAEREGAVAVTTDKVWEQAVRTTGIAVQVIR